MVSCIPTYVSTIYYSQVRFVGGLGEPGSGAGKGGGSGGSIRDAGGSMGKREAALEEEYFYKQVRIPARFPRFANMTYNLT